ETGEDECDATDGIQGGLHFLSSAPGSDGIAGKGAITVPSARLRLYRNDCGPRSAPQAVGVSRRTTRRPQFCRSCGCSRETCVQRRAFSHILLRYVSMLSKAELALWLKRRVTSERAKEEWRSVLESGWNHLLDLELASVIPREKWEVFFRSQL